MLKQISFGQALTSPFNRWLRRLLRSDGFQDVPECARRALVELWSGLLNSKLVEDLNKQLREREQRTSTNKVVARMEAWQTPSHHNLLASYQRSKGSENPALQPPNNFEFARLFEHTESAKVPERAAELAFLQSVVGKVSWPTCNPPSMQAQFIDLHLMMEASAKERWGMVEDAWHSSLVAEGVVLCSDTDTFLVVKQYARGVVGWPVRNINEVTLELDLSVEELKVVHVCDLESWHVRIPRLASPLRQQVLGANFPSGCRLMAKAAPISLLQHLISTGFSNIAEDSLRRLYTEWGLTEPRMTDAAKHDATLALSMGLLCHYDKKITEDEAVAKVLYYKFDDQTWGQCPKLDLEFLRDTILEGDREKIMKAQETAEANVTKRQAARQSVSSAARALFKERRGAPAKPAQKEAAAPKSKIAAKQSRVYVGLEQDADETLRREIPPGVTVWADEKNGRWRLKFADIPEARRSISWTNVGSEVGALICLKQAWAWAEHHTGAKTPAHLLSAFAENGVS